MNPKYRYLYLALGAVGLVLLFYQFFSNLPEIDPIKILLVAVPDMVFVFLAYKTYPPEPDAKAEVYSGRKVSNY